MQDTDTKIKKIGTVQNLDKDGYIINNLSLDDIQEEYKGILDDVLNFYKLHFKDNIHSIYLRGSVAKGKAVHYISDLDTVAISNVEITKEDLKVREAFLDEMKNKYPYLNGIEIFFIHLDKVMSLEKIQFVLQTQCICIHGTDLRKEIPKFGIGEWAYAHSAGIEKGLEEFKRWLEEDHTEEDLKAVCSWMMKMIVRIGFELVMEKEQCFTRDLHPCYESFSKHYPEKSNEMYEALKLAVFPTTDKDHMWKVINSLHDFLVTEIKKLKPNI